MAQIKFVKEIPIINGTYKKDTPHGEIGYQKWLVRKTYEVEMEYEIVTKTKAEAEDLLERKECVKVEEVDEYGETYRETIRGSHVNDMSGDELVVWNKLNKKDYLNIDQTIKLFQCKNKPDVSRPETIQKVAYHVRNGDSLGRIANRFNVSVTELVNWNKKVKKQSSLIHPGQYLIIYVDITQQYFDA